MFSHLQQQMKEIGISETDDQVSQDQIEFNAPKALDIERI